MKNILDRKFPTQQRVYCTYYKALSFILKITEALSILNYNATEKGNRTIRKTTAVIFALRSKSQLQRVIGDKSALGLCHVTKF